MINIDDKNRQEEIYPTEVERYEPAVCENRRERESLMVSKRGEKKRKENIRHASRGDGNEKADYVVSWAPNGAPGLRIWRRDHRLHGLRRSQ